MEKIRLLYIDLFCGAGGTSTGVENARYEGAKCAKVIACVTYTVTSRKAAEFWWNKYAATVGNPQVVIPPEIAYYKLIEFVEARRDLITDLKIFNNHGE